MHCLLFVFAKCLANNQNVHCIFFRLMYFDWLLISCFLMAGRLVGQVELLCHPGPMVKKCDISLFFWLAYLIAFTLHVFLHFFYTFAHFCDLPSFLCMQLDAAWKKEALTTFPQSGMVRNFNNKQFFFIIILFYTHTHTHTHTHIYEFLYILYCSNNKYVAFACACM